MEDRSLEIDNLHLSSIESDHSQFLDDLVANALSPSARSPSPQFSVMSASDAAPSTGPTELPLPKRRGKDLYLGAYVGGCPLTIDYKLSKSYSYRSTFQVRSAKARALAEKTLKILRDTMYTKGGMLIFVALLSNPCYHVL